MARLNDALGRKAARKVSYHESGDGDGLTSPEPSRKKVKQSQPRRPVVHDSEPSDNESDPEQHDPSHATSENSRVRINQAITALVKAGKDTLVYCDTTPLKSEPQVCPPALDLGLIKLSTAELLFLEDSVLYGYLTSNDFLPCIAQQKQECIDDMRPRSLLLAALPDDEYPFVETATYLAQKAPDYVYIIERNRILDHPHAEIMLICLKTAFIDAVGENPELKMIVPADSGQTEWSKARKREKKAGQTPRFKRKLVSFCDSDCTPRTDTHSRACTRKMIAAEVEWQEAKGYDVEADVPDQELAKVDFTFQQKRSTLIPPEQVISRFNQRDVVEPFSDEEKLVALRRFRMALDLRKGDMIDGAFEWTTVSEVLAGRSVADCVRFYYQHKHIIFMKLQKRPKDKQPVLPTDKPKWGPWVSAENQRRVGEIIDIQHFIQFFADQEAENTDLHIRNGMLEEDAVRMRSSEIFHRKRADRHMQSCRQKNNEIDRLKGQLKAVQRQKDDGMEAMKKQFEAIQLEKDEEIESLKKQLAESQVYGEERRVFGEWQDRRADDNLAQVERLKEELKGLEKELKGVSEEFKEAKEELKEAKEELKEAKQQLKGQQPRATGHDFLKKTTHTHTPKQWRGER